ncbi:hypothetical protein ACOSQ3_024991 [Xanthoceras sorbifolium]
MIGIGAIIRDNLGFLRAVISKTLPGIFSAEVGEILALREGLLLAKNLGNEVFLAEVDASNVALGVTDPISNYREAALVIKDIKALFQDVGVSKCQTISCLGISVAHNLASLTFSSTGDLLWQNVCLRDIFPYF